MTLGSITCGNSVIMVNGPYTVTISNVELTTADNTTVEHGIRNALGGAINVDHVYQHGGIDALCWCGNAHIRDSYSFIHLAIADDHLENLYLDGHTLTADHNTFINSVPQTANIFGNVNNGFGGACSNKLTVTNNFLAGGGWSIYPCGNGTSQGTSTTVITGNRFARCGLGVEVQGGGEEATFTRAQLDRLVTLGEAGIRQVTAAQKAALGDRWAW